MDIPNIEEVSVEILNNMENNIVYSRQEIINEQRRLLLVKKEEERKFQFIVSFAITRLCDSGMINRVNRGNYVISDFGMEHLRNDREELKKRIDQYYVDVKKNRIIAYKIFKSANERFLKEERENINRNISERNLCQNLANHLRDSMEEMRS